MQYQEHQAFFTWLFGCVLVIFDIGVFVFAPKTLPPFKHKILALLNALLAGLFGFFLTGSVGVEASKLPVWGKLALNASGGTASFLIVLWWWFSDFARVHVQQTAQPTTVHDRSQRVTANNNSGTVTITQHQRLTDEEVQHIVEKTIERLDDQRQSVDQQNAPKSRESREENERLKEELASAVRRAEQAERGGRRSAEGLIEELRANGNAERLLAFLIEDRDRLKDNDGLVARNREIAAIAYRLGKIDQTQEALNQVLTSEPNDRDAINRMGHIQTLHGELEPAEASYKRVLELSSDDLPWQSVGYGNLGVIYQIQGELDRAEEMHRKALKIEERLSRPEGIASECGNLGLLYIKQDKLDRAEEMHLKALEIDQRLGRPGSIASDYGNLALIYQARREFDRAEEMLRMTLKIFERLGWREGMADAYGNLGIIYIGLRELDRAEEMLLKALEIHKRLDKPEGIASDHDNLGTIYRNRGELDRAEEMHRKALKINERLGRPEGMANQYCNFGAIYAIRGEFDQARQAWTKAHDLFEQIGMMHMVTKVQGLLDRLPE